MSLREILLSLDPDNDEQWTEQGLPRLDVLKGLANRVVTRDEINAEINGFNRSLAKEGLGTETPVQDEPITQATEETEQAEADEQETPLESSEEELASKEVLEFTNAIGEIDDKIHALRKERELLINKRDEIVTRNESKLINRADTVKAFQAAQLKQRMKALNAS